MATTKTRRKPEMILKSDRSSGHGGVMESPGSRSDVIIVGAGVAGAALAYALAKDGRRVHVLERDLTKPDRIVGELLHPGGYLKLIKLGLEDCVDGIESQQVFGYSLYMNEKYSKFSYPLEKFDFNLSGRTFHNGRFVQRIRDKASSLQNVKMEQGTVTSLVKRQGSVHGVQYKTKDQESRTAYANLTVVCDGCFSNLRGALCNPKIKVSSCFVALVLENTNLPHANHVHVILANPSFVLFYSISNTETRCLVDVPGQKVPSTSNGEMAKYLKTIVAPQIPNELYNPFVAAVDKGNVRTMPNRSMSADPNSIPGAVLIGDALDMRHPLTGGGMTVALSDVVLLRDLLRPFCYLNDSRKFLECFYTLRKPMSFTINTIASVVYNVFSSSYNPVRNEMCRACFGYLSLGGMFLDGPMSLFSGLNPHPMLLFLHSIAMTIYSVNRVLIPFPSPNRLWLATRLILDASLIVFPIVKSEGVIQIMFSHVPTPSYPTIHHDNPRM